MRCFRLAFVLLAGTVFAVAAAKPHVVSFGAPIQVKVPAGSAEDKTLDVTIRALYVDTRLKEYTTGARHDVTDRLFVIQRAFRINDALPDDPKKHPKWLWQRGGWLLVDRSSGKVSALKLADFDPYHSEVSWYRDYAAYCGVPENGDGVYALVTQIGIHKPLFRKSLGKTDGDALVRCRLRRAALGAEPGARDFWARERPEVHRQCGRTQRRCDRRFVSRRTVAPRSRAVEDL